MFFLRKLPTSEMTERYAQRYSGMDPATLVEALELMRKASLLLRELEHLFSAADLSQTRFLILMLLDREPDTQRLAGLRHADLSEELDVSKPVISKALKSLESAGLVTIGASPDDGRAKKISITRYGREKLNQLLPSYYSTINTFMAEWSIETTGQTGEPIATKNPSNRRDT